MRSMGGGEKIVGVGKWETCAKCRGIAKKRVERIDYIIARWDSATERIDISMSREFFPDEGFRGI